MVLDLGARRAPSDDEADEEFEMPQSVLIPTDAPSAAAAKPALGAPPGMSRAAGTGIEHGLFACSCCS